MPGARVSTGTQSGMLGVTGHGNGGRYAQCPCFHGHTERYARGETGHGKNAESREGRGGVSVSTSVRSVLKCFDNICEYQRVCVKSGVGVSFEWGCGCLEVQALLGSAQCDYFLGLWQGV